jgi:sigma-B regulation protein RsbU (phosphoserine phosphatase)
VPSEETVHSTSDEKLRRLQSVTDAALSRLGVEDLLDQLLERTCDLLAADTASVLLLDSTGTELVATAAAGLAHEVRLGVRMPIGDGFAGTVAARGEPIVLERVGHFEPGRPSMLMPQLISVLGVPMLNEGRVSGVLLVGTLRPRRFGTDDIELLQLVADRASLATQARLSRLDRAATVALQRSLLPARPQRIAGLDVAARYVPGAKVGVGGDWYDLFALPSGRIGIVIGDVAGSGLHAAVVMGRIRSALRAYALETDDPADVLTRLDRKVQLFEPDAMATAIYAVLDPDHSGLTLSNAGHLPPALIHPARPAEALRIDPDLPLGAYRDAPRRNLRVRFPEGSGLFLYTDGLVERRGRPISAGITRLVGTLGTANADAVCSSAMQALLAEEDATDDIAVLAVRRLADGEDSSGLRAAIHAGATA